MKWTTAVLAVALSLGGCAGSKQTWQATCSTDASNHQTTLMVSPVDIESTNWMLPRPVYYFPVIRKEGNELLVGVMSAGRARLPVGTVQLMVDQHEAWTITPLENPVSLSPVVFSKGGADSQGAASQMMAPYTLACGDKAKRIIRELAAGQTLRYRIGAIDQAGATTGEAVIDRSFAQALRAIGVDAEPLLPEPATQPRCAQRH